MDRKERRQIQGERLKKLVENLYNNVKFYHDKFDEYKIKPSDIKSMDDIEKLPFTEKEDLRNNYPLGLLQAPLKDIVRIHASSGTTGKPTIIAYTKNDIDIWSEVMARALSSSGADQTSVIQVSYGYGLFTGGLGAHYGSERLGATTLPASSGNSKKQLTLMKDLGVDVICCTPTYALYLAEQMKVEGLDKSEFKLKAGVFGAETWGENLRKQIENELGIKAYDVYGLSEISGPGVGIECEYQCGCHIQEDHFYPEIIDSKTLKVLPYGQEGELVFTTLTKTGMPLLRYRTHDVAKLVIEPCKCGRTTIRISRIKGRCDDMLIVRGVNVYPSEVESVILNFKELNNKFELNLIKNGVLDELLIKIEVKDDEILKNKQNLMMLYAKLSKEFLSALNIKVKVELLGHDKVNDARKRK